MTESMTVKAKQPKKSKTRHDRSISVSSIPFDAALWLKNFIVDFEDHFATSASTLPTTTEASQLQKLAVLAAVQTLVNSGMNLDSLQDVLGEVMSSQQSANIKWDERHNQRRIELIDKDIQETLTLQEGVELAQLTRSMRDYLQVHHPLEMEGTRKLHQKLITLRNTAITELK